MIYFQVKHDCISSELIFKHDCILISRPNTIILNIHNMSLGQCYCLLVNSWVSFVGISMIKIG